MAELSFNEVRKTYPNGFKAIHGVSMDVSDGELIVIVGPSGCGKSTLMRMVAGLEQVSEGEIQIDGRRVNELEPADRDIAMVFQNYALYPHMSVFDNMAYGLRNRGTAKDEIETRVAEASKILQLDQLLDRRPNQLSGGQRQRVAMGRAIVRNPSVFLFDEPLSNLDAKLRVQMRLEIKRLQRSLGTTSLYVTHDQVEAMTLADRLIVMNGGVAEQIGTPLEVYENPASTFVATFIGSPAMNLIPADLQNSGGRVGLPGGLGVDLPGPVPGGRSAVTVGIRPEHVQVMGEGNGIPFSLELVENLGADQLLHGRLEGNDDLLTVRASAESGFAAGQSVSLSIPSHKLHVFDKDSGVKIDLPV